MWICSLSIGNEIINGDRLNTNAHWVAQQLVGRGLQPNIHLTLPDNAESILSFLDSVKKKEGLLISSGGLGPTLDDQTRAIIAKWLKVPLEENSQARQDLSQWALQKNRVLQSADLLQTQFPKGARIIANPLGSASGFYIRQKNLHLAFFPGVPVELKAMFQNFIDQFFRENKAQLALPTVHQKKIWTFGWPESEQGKLDFLNKLPPCIQLSSLPSEEGVQLGLSFTGSSSKNDFNPHLLLFKKTWKQLVKSIPKEKIIFPAGLSVLEALIFKLLQRKETLALAESLTGGYTGYVLTQMSGSSKWFVESAVTYLDKAKNRRLGISPKLLRQQGAVSEEVSLAMAKAILKKSGAHWALSLTGYAELPSSPSSAKAGEVWMSVAHSSGFKRTQKVFLPGNRDQVRKRSAYAGLFFLLSCLEEVSL